MKSQLERNLAQRITVGDIIRRHARHEPGRIALVEKRGNEEIRLDYRQLNAQINSFGNGLIKLGCKNRDKVAFVCLNSAEFVIALFGCAKGGQIVVPLNPGMAPDDIIYMVNQSEASCLVADDMFAPHVSKLKKHCPNVKHYISLPVAGAQIPDDFIQFNTLIQDQSEAEVEEIIWERDTFGIYYTSGTTSRPKGTVISHLSTCITTMSNVIEFGLKSGAVCGMELPAFHIAQHCINMMCLLRAGKLVISRAFDPTRFLNNVQSEKINLALLLPIMWKALLAHPKLKSFDVSSLQTGMFAMAPMDKPSLTSLIETFTPNFFLATGQTEFIPSSECFRPEWQLRKTGNYWGEPALLVETAIMDENGNILPQGEVGEIVRRGPGALTEYLKNEEATREKTKYGWAHSEDIGYFDEDGLLVFSDRKKDMIKSGGENVPSIKVEQVVMAHPDVAEVAVVGLPHDRWTEAITAFVILNPGSNTGEEDLITFCKKQLGGFEVPKKIVICQDLPKSSTGKMRKNVIKEQYQGLYRGE
jgi:long-chain acyl-CoA synthetase